MVKKKEAESAKKIKFEFKFKLKSKSTSKLMFKFEFEFELKFIGGGGWRTEFDAELNRLAARGRLVSVAVCALARIAVQTMAKMLMRMQMLRCYIPWTTRKNR